MHVHKSQGRRGRMPPLCAVGLFAACCAVAPMARAQHAAVAAAPADGASLPAPEKAAAATGARRHSAFGEAMRNLTQALHDAGAQPQAATQPASNGAGSAPQPTPGTRVESPALAADTPP